MTERKTYQVTASKDGRWWLVQVPELDTVGQARNAAEVEEVAREVIGLWLDLEPDTFDVAVSIEIPGEAREAWEEAKQRAAVAREENAAAAALARRAVASLRADGLTFKDAGVVLGLSAQRVQQLAADIENVNAPAGYTKVVQAKSGRSNATRSNAGGETRAANKSGRRRAGV
ncbi:antitoxin HicB [Agromyces humatus]|uniref:Type II toxin-antitoxin system HicB family antitoxin n=1 Tax=Agromyces humatus TaxID=279573 RepID=A0ABP4XAE3_9MICO